MPAGHRSGPLPKDPANRARRNKDTVQATVIAVTPTKQPHLPTKQPNGDPWPARTREWWRMWGRSPLSQAFIEADWDYLLDTAVVHARLWSGDTGAAPELRLRAAKFGVTAEDRARLRITFATADKVESEAPKGGVPKPAEPRQRPRLVSG